MELIIEHKDFSKNKLSLTTAGFFRGSKIFLNDRELSKEKRKYIAQNDQNEQVTIKLKNRLIDPIPKVEIDDQEIEIAPPLKIIEYIWMALPVLLVFGGGALGGVCGFIAAYSSSRIFRSNKNTLTKYLQTGLISITATIIFVILATGLSILIEKV